MLLFHFYFDNFACLRCTGLTKKTIVNTAMLAISILATDSFAAANKHLFFVNVWPCHQPMF